MQIVVSIIKFAERINSQIQSNSLNSIIHIVFFTDCIYILKLLATICTYIETTRRFSSASHVQKFGTPSKTYAKVNQQISIHSEEIHSTAIPKFFGSSPATADDSSRIPNFPRCKTRAASTSGASTCTRATLQLKCIPPIPPRRLQIP